MDDLYIVYVKIGESGCITAVNSSAFLTNTADWTEIDRGYGDQYHHAQGNYFPKSIITDGGAHRYRLSDGKIAECTPEEIARQETENQNSSEPSTEERIAELETQNEILMQCILEMSEVLYA